MLKALLICLLVPRLFAQLDPADRILSAVSPDAATFAISGMYQQSSDQSSIPNVTDQPPATPPQTQPPNSAANQAQTTTQATVKQRKLNCQHPANPSRRRFGCKDEEFDWDEVITGDWTGVREEARKVGITPSVSYYSALQTNATGNSRQVLGYTGQLTFALDVNFEKLIKIPGMSLYFSNTWGTGSNLTAAIGSVFAVNPNYAVGAYLGEIYLQQKLLGGKLTVAAGRLGADCTFASLPAFDNYVSYAINPTPASLVVNDLSYSGPPPGLQWGAEATYDPTPVVELAAGVFNTNPNAANNGNIFAFQQGNKGALVTAQASYLYRQRPEDRGMRGQYTAGFFEDSNSFATLPGGTPKSDGNAGVFVLGQQLVYRPDGPGTSRGLTVWGAWAYSSKQLVSPMPVFTGAGVSYEGLIKQRKQDIASIGWMYGKTSQWIPNASSAKMLEANYQWVYKRYLAISPDFQYIWNPTGKNGRGAAVFGVQLFVTL